MTQLSLFTESDGNPEQGAAGSDAPATARSPKPRQKRVEVATAEAAPKRSRVVRERGKFETLYLPFDDSPVSTAATLPPPEAVVAEATVVGLPPAPEKRVTPPVTPSVVADLFSYLAEEEEAPRRIVFDPQVWQLRPESGDFIQIRTGEVREEDEFLPMERDEAPDEFPAEWAID